MALATAVLVGSEGTAYSGTWRPGDDIPGWPDFDCGPPPVGAHVLWPILPAPSEAYAMFVDDVTTVQPMVWSVEAGDCLHPDYNSPCEPDNGLSVMLDDMLMRAGDPAVDAEPFGTGWFRSNPEQEYITWAYAAVMWDTPVQLMVSYPDDHYDHILSGVGRVCLERSRPDNLVARVEFEFSPEEAASSRYDLGPYESLHAAGWLDAVIPTHSGTIENGDYECIRGEYLAVEYGASPDAYDLAWPWDWITDDDVRQQVYDMYTPCNLPEE